jgi:hypothetical protein
MNNFTFKSRFYDNNHTQEVARRLKRRAEIYKTNHLEFILNPRQTTTHFSKRIRFGETGTDWALSNAKSHISVERYFVVASSLKW